MSDVLLGLPGVVSLATGVVGVAVGVVADCERDKGGPGPELSGKLVGV